MCLSVCQVLDVTESDVRADPAAMKVYEYHCVRYVSFRFLVLLFICHWFCLLLPSLKS